MSRCLIVVVCTVAALSVVGSAEARRLRAGDAVPFSHGPCSVLDGEPCTPTTCSVFDHGPCIPEIDYPVGQNLQVTVLSVPPDDRRDWYRRPDHDLDTIGDLFAALRSCWSPPSDADARQGMQMSVMFSFNTSGRPIAPPRVTFFSKEAPKDLRDTYLAAINTSLDDCLPLKLTRGLGGAIAGRPIMIRYVDNRELGQPQGK
jgi:hypothetical protein